MKIIKRQPTDIAIIELFINQINFRLPIDFIDFYRDSNGAEIYTDNEYYIILWPLSEMIQLNIDYNVDEYADCYFIFGSDGSDTAYCIEKLTGTIFELPFIGMSNDEAMFKAKSLKDLFSI